MPFVVQNPETWRRKVRRALLVGGPNTGKTTSLRTCTGGPATCLSFPGEMGTTSIPLQTLDGHEITPRIWEGDCRGSAGAAAIRDLKAVTKNIIASKPHTLMGDGLHKLFPVFMDDVTFGAFSRGDEFDAKLWSKGTGTFLDYLHSIMNSEVPNVLFTIWQGPEADSNTGAIDAGKKDRHVYPELPGKASSRIVGEFSLTLYCFREAGQFKWLTQPQGEIGGVGAKLPEAVLKRLPARVPQHWADLMKVLEA